MNGNALVGLKYFKYGDIFNFVVNKENYLIFIFNISILKPNYL
jgi:hypothetical protein